MKLVNESKNMNVRISRYDLLIEHVEALLEYEKRGIPTIDPPPSKVLSERPELRDKIVVQGVTEEVEKLLAKAEIASSPKTSINEANKALLKIRESKNQLIDKTKLDELETKVKRLSHETQLNSFLDAARKAEFKGQKKKALDQYQEALYFLKTDDVDDSLQAERIGEIETKISEISK
jgi:hypothetical protein